MSAALPLVIDLVQAARQDTRLHGELAISSMPRLVAQLASGDGQAQVDLRVHLDEGGARVVDGHIDAELQLQCQRCLEPMRFSAHTDTRLAWVKTEDEAAALSGDFYEPLLAPDGRVTVAELVADELLLALPFAARHETLCGESVELQVRRPPPDEEKKSPFEALAALKRKR